jgi:predicted nucleic acid-binding protein
MTKAIVLDANILIRAVLGVKVRKVVTSYAHEIQFFAPDVAYADAWKYLPMLLEKRGVPSEPAMAVLESLAPVIQVIDAEVYAGMKSAALKRIGSRDADDWPVLACAMIIGCPVWTEDADFFGTGVATWTSDRIELYFA